LKEKSEATARTLDSLKYAPRAYYSGRVITNQAALLVSGIVIVVAVLVAILVARPPSEDTPPK
jgi:hypothetical protein